MLNITCFMKKRKLNFLFVLPLLNIYYIYQKDCDEIFVENFLFLNLISLEVR